MTASISRAAYALLLRNRPLFVALSAFSKLRIGQKFFTTLWPSRGAFQTFQAAHQVCDHLAVANPHRDQTVIQQNFQLSVDRRPSDYPVLFWLYQLTDKQPISVLDFGGGIGQTYYQYSKMLRPGAIKRWTVYDLPESVAHGKKIPEERREHNLHFTADLKECGGHDVFHSAGALHFCEKSIDELDQAVGNFPDHVIINRSPINQEGHEFITIAKSKTWAAPIVVRSLSRVIETFGSLGFKLVDQWLVDKWRQLPLFPHLDTQYLGIYLARGESQMKHSASDGVRDYN